MIWVYYTNYCSGETPRSFGPAKNNGYHECINNGPGGLNHALRHSIMQMGWFQPADYLGCGGLKSPTTTWILVSKVEARFIHSMIPAFPQFLNAHSILSCSLGFRVRSMFMIPSPRISESQPFTMVADQDWPVQYWQYFHLYYDLLRPSLKLLRPQISTGFERMAAGTPRFAGRTVSWPSWAAWDPWVLLGCEDRLRIDWGSDSEFHIASMVWKTWHPQARNLMNLCGSIHVNPTVPSDSPSPLYPGWWWTDFPQALGLSSARVQWLVSGLEKTGVQTSYWSIHPSILTSSIDFIHFFDHLWPSLIECPPPPGSSLKDFLGFAAGQQKWLFWDLLGEEKWRISPFQQQEIPKKRRISMDFIRHWWGCCS